MSRLLTDVCKIQYGFPFDSSQFNSEEGAPVIRIRDIVRGSSNTYTLEPCGEEYVVNNGDLLVGMDGEFNIAKWQGKRAVLNQRVCKVIPELVDRDYLYYYLQNVLKRIESATPFATVKHLSAKEINKIELPEVSIEKQKITARKLLIIDELINKYKKRRRCLEEFVKSRFIELFGDGNDERFPLKTLPQIVAKDRHALKRGPFGGALKKDDFVESGYLVYEQRHAIHNDFEHEKYYISPKKYQEMSMFKVSPGDLIISCSGVTLGRIAEIPVYAKAGIINQALLKVSLDQSIMLNTFFVHQFRSERIQDILFGFCRGSGIPNFPSMSEVKSVKFICPPIALQEQFAAFVEQTDKSKMVIQQSLEKLEILKKALMQKYFV